jgi:hypothetical protein
MAVLFARDYSLVPRGAAGLSCDEDGIALGPMPLVEAVSDAFGRRCYRMRSAAEVAQAFRLAHGSASDEIERYQRGLARITELLSAGEGARARIEAVLLAIPEIAPEGMTKLAQAVALRKDNPDWVEKPRIPAGIPEGGDWTSDGDGSEAADDANFQPAAAQTNDVQSKKERFVDAHLVDAQKGAERLGLPVENILGLSALESTWGEHRFAIQGNNFFGIHFPAPFATGYMLTKDRRTKVAAFASYADSLRSFVAISGSIVQGKRDPKAFATALQNSGKFGIDPETGAKVPSYVGDVSGTIRGIRSIVARRRI